MSHPSPSPYDVTTFQTPPQGQTAGLKRSRAEPQHLQHMDLPSPIASQHHAYAQTSASIQVDPAQAYSLQGYPQAPVRRDSLPHQHHHHLPNQQPLKRPRMEGEASSPVQPTHGPPNVVGHEGMPPPAQRPRGPKLKFTPEDDQLLVDLKEKKNLAWKQIADFFPGRSSGTLQVRYCTKLKAKTTVWTDDMVQKLRNSMQEYETDRWRIISSKVGSGFSPAACREKAQELEAIEAEGEEEEQSGYSESQLETAGSADPGPSYSTHESHTTYR